MAPYLGWTPSSGVLTPTTEPTTPRTQHAELTHQDHGREDIAVVGMACRLAGNNNSPGELWKYVLEQKVASGEIPPLRWEAYSRRDSRNPKVLKDTTSKGYFLHNIEDFDCVFFGISPKEALLMDPQQRISLEVAWEALEDAGIPPQSLAGSNTACFMGVNSDDYSKLLLEDLPGVEAWMGIGTAYCGVPNRISYLMDLRGPSTAVDAACASSLVAIHHGRQSLLAKETDLAIVGGVNAMCGPGLTRVLDKAGAISKDGTCRSFDHEANGYGRGEGAAIIILKRHSDALRDSDNVLAVLKGSAVGQDGRTNGIMAPNGIAQEAVARTALGQIDPLSIQYVEAHATSTSMGDPVEITAMSNLYGKNRPASSPCYIGSVKPNVGHLEAGAGGVGFIKAVMALRNGTIPPQANLNSLNQKIDWENAGIKVPQQVTNWPAVNGAKRAAICSYGYGGTVSHAVIEQAPPVMRMKTAIKQDDEPTILLLTSTHDKRISLFASSLHDWMTGNGGEVSSSSIGATLAARRGHHDFRAAIVTQTRKEATDLLSSYAKGNNTSQLITSRVMDKTDTRVVWMFSGHGAQWADMGKELLANEPVFRNAIEDLAPRIQAEAGFCAIQALSAGDISSTDRVQILTYAVQVALASLLESKGAKPDAIIGHSVGEIAAAVVADALTPDEGAIIVCRRAMLYRQVMGKGAMCLVNLPICQASQLLEGRLDIYPAIDSSPSSCVVAGTVTAVKEFSSICEQEKVKVFQVNSDVAFHTPLLNPIAEPLLEVLRDISPKAPNIPLYSTATKDPREQAPRDGCYWLQNTLSPVLLKSTVRAAVDDGYRIFMEVSSHPVISHSVNETVMDMDVEEYLVTPTLLRNKPARLCLLKSLATLWSKGASIDWKSYFSGVEWAKDVPKTQWQHTPFWKKVEAGTRTASQLHDVDSHTLVGQRIPVAGETKTVFTTKLEESTKPFPGNHPLHGTEIVPAAVLFNTFLAATGTQTLSNIHLRVPVAISAPRDVEVIADGDSVRIMSRLIPTGTEKAEADPNSSWLTHITASMKSNAPAEGSSLDIASIEFRIETELKSSFSIDYLLDVGVPEMGFPWTVTRHVGNTEEMLARVDVCPEIKDGDAFPWKSTSWAPVFDAATSIGSTIFYETPRLRMPAQVDEVAVYQDAAPPKIAYIYVQRSKVELASDVTVAAEDGRILAKFTTMRFAEIEGSIGSGGRLDELVHSIAWVPARLAETSSELKRVVIVGSDDQHIVRKYIRQLSKRSISAACVSVEDLDEHLTKTKPEGAIIVYVPHSTDEIENIQKSAEKSCFELLEIVKLVAAKQLQIKIFAITEGAFQGETISALAQSPLVGLGRIIASEQPDNWGALIDVESSSFPFQAVRYISGADIIKIEDSVAKVARLRPLAKSKASSTQGFTPRPEGTYLISGGLGSLGLEVAAHLVEQGARRIVLLSRRSLPSRKDWDVLTGVMVDVVSKIKALEELGASIHVLAIDLSSRKASSELGAKVDALNLPPIRGIVHAAGVLEDQLVLATTASSFARVLAPKIDGALALHNFFPPNVLDFFILFSSCGQLFGFPGQASYASGNAFLDSLAEHRRQQGDNAVAFQWTSWKGVGGMGDNEFVEAEVESRGFTSVTKSEAFAAWNEVAKRDVSHAVVLRSRLLDVNEPLPSPILEDIAVRKAPAAGSPATNPTSEGDKSSSGGAAIPKGPERIPILTEKIAGCVASVLQLAGAEDVDPKAALADLGMDSVMTVAFRKLLQQELKVKVPPTLVWGHPTVSHLVKWFDGQIG
ncbi:polyketide syntase 2 [Leptodontidium sp. MPI-SDFR-AT-0119]|nr:polyketide syntase 2 [Leptodontidium sp. MPI-SDFR-AT-0119]